MTKEQLSIAYVFEGNYITGEGVPSYIRTFGEHFAEQGHDVSFIVGDSPSRDPNVYSLGQTKSIRFNGNKIDISLWAPKDQVTDILDTVRPDIMHVQMAYSPFLGARFVNQAAPETGLVGTFHIVPESPISRVGAHILGLLDGRSQRKFDSLLSVSPSAQEFARTAFHADTDVIPCPTDLSKFKNGRRLEEYDDGKVNIVFMGRLVERKGCRYLIDAISSLDPKLQSNIRLLIAGRGPLLQKLETQTREAGIDRLVSFLGFVEDEDKPDILASADIAVFPSTGGESFGIILLEAMASGSGVVLGGNNVGYRAVLNGRDEFLFDPKNVSGFTKILSELVMDPDRRDALHSYQQELVTEYDISRLGPRMLQLYRRILEGKQTA